MAEVFQGEDTWRHQMLLQEEYGKDLELSFGVSIRVSTGDFDKISLKEWWGSKSQ